MKFWHLSFAVGLLLTILSGCGGAGSTIGGGGTGNGDHIPPPTPTTLGGRWEVFFQSNVARNEFIVLEANLILTNKHLSSETNGAVIFSAQGPLPYQPVLQVTHLGGGCHDGVEDEVIFDGTVEEPKSGTQSASFTLTENSTLGSAVITATASISPTGLISGTYTLPAACGFPEDNGTISGNKDDSNFSAQVYKGTLDGKSVSLSFALGTTGATASGTYGGTPFSLAGFASGDALTMKGVISSQETMWFVLYDSLYNLFRIYDFDANLLGTLTETP